MLVCAMCGRELECSKTGKAVYFNNLRFAGDEYGCPECGYYIIKANELYVESDPSLDNSSWIRGRNFWDEVWTKEEVEKSEERCSII